MNGPGGDASGGRHGPTGGGAARLVNTSTHILMGLPTFMPLDHMTCLCNYRGELRWDFSALLAW